MARWNWLACGRCKPLGRLRQSANRGIEQLRFEVNVQRWAKRAVVEVVSASHDEVMTVLILLAGLTATVATVVGYVAWRERRTGRSFIDPSVSREALTQVHLQAVRGRLAEADMLAINLVEHSPGTRSQGRLRASLLET
jgi:hypothetical protein